MILGDFLSEAANPAQQAAIAIAMRKAGKKPKDGGNKHNSMKEAARVARKPGQPADSKKHSDLYTDENPRGTITGLKFATVEDARASVAKIRNSGRSHAHKIQAAVAMEQRARAAGKASAAAVYRAYINTNKKTDEGVDLEEACWKGYHKEGMKTMFGKRYPNCVKNKKTTEDTIQEFVNETLGQKNSNEIRRIQQMLNKKFNANLDVDGVLGPLTKQSIMKFLPSADTAPAPDPKRTTAVQGLKDKSMQEQHCPNCGGPMFSELMINEKQDACYYKVKSRYKVWPSAYASGALVQCRKKGAANWGNKSR